jgi:tetratricopeptide (TPR) repeat protein
MPTTAPRQRHDFDMVAVAPLAPVRPEHANGLRTLEKIIRHYNGFQLILALYNDPPDYRNRLIDHLNGLVDQSDRVNTRTCADFLTFGQRLATACTDSDLVHVVGLDAWLREKAGEQRLQGFNLHRKTLAADCPKPIILWLPVHLATQFALQAPDVWEWRRAVLDFSVEGGALPDSLLTLLDRISVKGKPINLPVSESLNDEGLEEPWGHARFSAEASLIERLKYSGLIEETLEASIKLYRQFMVVDENAYPEAKFDIAMAYLIVGDALSKSGAAEQAIPLLEEAQRSFERIEQNPITIRWAAVALQEQGNCLRYLGRYEQAIFVYGESMRKAQILDDRLFFAVIRMQLGTAFVCQKKYNQALIAYEEAKETFHLLNNRYNLAVVLQLIGWLYTKTERYEDAERVHQESLVITKTLDDVGGLASCLGELGNLYQQMNRLEDAAAYYRQAINILVNFKDTFREGLARGNLALILVKLGQIAEARVEIVPAIKCNEPYGYAAIPWQTWYILSRIETIDGNKQAAEEARQKALELFLAYRRDGGENNKYSGSVCKAIGEALQASNKAGARRYLRNNQHNPAYSREGNPEPLLDVLTEIINGNRDPSLADNPELTYDQAAEIILLLESLESLQVSK